MPQLCGKTLARLSFKILRKAFSRRAAARSSYRVRRANSVMTRHAASADRSGSSSGIDQCIADVSGAGLSRCVLPARSECELHHRSTDFGRISSPDTNPRRGAMKTNAKIDLSKAGNVHALTDDQLDQVSGGSQVYYTPAQARAFIPSIIDSATKTCSIK